MKLTPGQSSREVAEELLLDADVRRKLLAFACSQFGINGADAEDLLQETAFELLRYESYVRRPDGFVFTVFRSRCVRFARARRNRREVTTGFLSPIEDRPDAMQDDAGTRKIALQEALREISVACRRLLSAHYVEGLSLREAARLVSIRYSSVGKTMGRCLKKLRRLLA